MKITDIEVIDSFDGSRDDCVIRIYTNDGITGIAVVNSAPAIVRAAIEA